MSPPWAGPAALFATAKETKSSSFQSLPYAAMHPASADGASRMRDGVSRLRGTQDTGEHND